MVTEKSYDISNHIKKGFSPQQTDVLQIYKFLQISQWVPLS